MAYAWNGSEYQQDFHDFWYLNQFQIKSQLVPCRANKNDQIHAKLNVFRKIFNESTNRKTENLIQIAYFRN